MKHRWTEMERLIFNSSTTVELRKLRDEFHDALDAAFPEMAIVDFLNLINSMHNALIQKTVELTEKRVRETFGSQPVSSFAFLLFGSGGRMEQTLWSDQDNGLIFEVADGAGPRAGWRGGPCG